MSRYVRIEDWRFRTRRVGASALRFYGILRSYCRTDTEVRGDMDGWAAAAGVSKSAAKKLMKELVESGWVTRKARGEYELDAPPGAREGQQSGPSKDSRAVLEGQQSGPSHHTQGTTKPQRTTLSICEEQHLRVTSLRAVAERTWPKASHFAHGFIDSLLARLAMYRPLTVDQLATIAGLEAEARQSESPRLRLVKDDPDHQERRRLEEQARMERLEDEERRRQGLPPLDPFRSLRAA